MNPNIQSGSINLQSSSLPRPSAHNFSTPVSQPDVSAIFQNVRSTDMSQAQASSKYLRTTSQCAPNSPTLAKQWGLPFGAVFRPFADQDDEIPVVSMGSAGVVRCHKCRAYINPFVLWMDGGRRWQCNLCRYSNDVSTPYYSPLDEYGIRKDIHRRKELRHGSIELIATKDYCTRKNPQPPAFMFLIDVSHNTVQSGALRVICDSILSSLDHMVGDVRTKVGIITFNSTLHFYNLNKDLDTPKRYIIGELDQSLLPIPSDLLVNYFDSKHIVKKVLQTIPDMYETMLQNGSIRDGENCLGSALNAGGRILGKIGGKLSVFLSSIPTLGINSLKNRESYSNYDTPKETEMLKPATSNFRDLALLFSKDQLCVDQYILTAQYTDIASLQPLSKFTAGSIKQYPGFEAKRDGQTLKYDIIRSLTREQGLEAVMKVRVSSGFKVKNFYGNFFIRGHDLLALPGVDSDKSFGFELQHTGSFVSTPNACIQAAVLYTNSDGQRRVRIHNLILPLTSQLSDLFKHSDAKAVANLLAKRAIDDIPRNGLKTQREHVINTLVESLKSYQKNVRGQSGRSYHHLVLPDSLRLLPLITSGMLKHDAFAMNTEVRADARISAMNYLSTCSTVESALNFHPLLFAVHQIEDAESEEESSGEDSDSEEGSFQFVQVPQLLPLTSKSTSDPNGVYLLCDGLTLFVSHKLNPVDNSALIEDINAVSNRMNTFPLPRPKKVIGETSMGRGLCRLVKQLRRQFQFMPIILVHPQQQQFIHKQFLRRMIEDKQSSADASYQEFVQNINQKINQ